MGQNQLSPARPGILLVAIRTQDAKTDKTYEFVVHCRHHSAMIISFETEADNFCICEKFKLLGALPFRQSRRLVLLLRSRHPQYIYPRSLYPCYGLTPSRSHLGWNFLPGHPVSPGLVQLCFSLRLHLEPVKISKLMLRDLRSVLEPIIPSPEFVPLPSLQVFPGMTSL